VVDLTYALHSARGKRHRENQDAVFAHVPSDPRRFHQKGALFVVADGMGGRPAGAVASQLAVRTTVQHYYGSHVSDPSQALSAAVDTAGNWLRYWSSQRADLRGMGTTLTAAVVLGQHLHIAHVGDSRAYLLRGDSVWRLTQDQTWVAGAVQRGLLTPQEARRHPWRNVLEGYLGGEQCAPVSIRRFACQPSDALILCSDGISDWMAGRELSGLLSHDSRKSVHRFARAARHRGSYDDASIIIVNVKQPHSRAYHAPIPLRSRSHRSGKSTTLAFKSGQAAFLLALAGIVLLFLLMLTLLGR
jgi:protein phosphatase